MLINDVYFPYLENKDRYLLLYGSAGSGKSIFAGQKLILRCLQETNHRILCVRKVRRTIKDSIFAQITDSLIEDNLSSVVLRNKSELSFHFPNGNQIITTGLDDPEKIKSIAGITSIWGEEITEFSEEDFIQTDLRMRGENDTYFQYIMSFNPIDRMHWIKKRFFDRPQKDATILHTTYKDNAYLDEQYIKTLESLKHQDENYYKIYALGEWGGLVKGLIFTNWEVVEELPKAEDYVYGLDFGYNNPSVLLKVGILENQLTVEEVIYKTNLTNTDLIELMKEKNINKYTEIFSDTEPQRIEEIYRAGYNIKPADKSVNDGIDRVKRFKLLIDKNATNMIEELRLYKWKEDKNGNVLDEPVKFMDHACDALRYSTTNMIKQTPSFRVFDV